MLDLTHVFKTVSEKFPDAGVACLLIGGFTTDDIYHKIKTKVNALLAPEQNNG